MITTNTSLKALSHLFLMFMMICNPISVIFSQQISSDCEDLTRMDVHVKGIKNRNTPLNITLGSGTNRVTMECVCRDIYDSGPCPNTVTFTVRKPNGTTQNVTATGFFVNVDDDDRFPSKMYRVTYYGTANRVTYNAPAAASRPSMRGLVVWQQSVGDDNTPNFPNNHIVDRFFYQTPSPQIYDIYVPTATDPRDFVVRIPIHEHGNNQRPIVYQVKAYDGNTWSGIVNRTVTANNAAPEIRLDQITLNNINKDVYAIRVSIQSPGNFVGTSVVVGTIMVTSTPCIIVLPIELSDFKAIPEGVYNKISWTTDTELNSDYFELERRIQGGGWKRVERIDAAGYSESTKSYYCLDEFPIAENYYRLKSVDIDGSFEYSEVIYLDRKDLNILLSNIYIDQISDNLIIRFNTDLSTEKTSIKLFDVNGRTIYKLINSPLKEFGEFTIDMNNYPTGAYFISVYANDKRQIEKVIKQ